MRVEIWSDVVCPWCYIGKERFGLDPDEIAQSGEVCGPDGTCAVPQR
jgi:predicted DsbA family dithiol-disulfide isomerase